MRAHHTNRLTAVLAAAVTLGGFALPSPVRAGDASRSIIRGDTVYANVYSSDVGGGHKGYLILASAEVTSTPGPPTDGQSSVLFSFFLTDPARGLDLTGFGSAKIPPGGLQLQGLNQATLDVTIPLTVFVYFPEWDMFTATAQVHLTFTGTGENFQSVSQNHFMGPGFSVHTRTVGSMRLATPTGSAVVDDDIIGNLGPVEGAPSDATIGTAKEGEVTITR
jgi:hypothetical protein